MKKHIGLVLLAGLLVFSQSCTQKSDDPAAEYLLNEAARKDAGIVIHLRGVDRCNISLSPLAGSRASSPVRLIKGIADGGSDTIRISHYYLPGEFLLGFDSCRNGENDSSLCKKYIIVTDQDLEIWINPLFGDNPDSTWFQAGEKENNAWQQFIRETGVRRESLLSTYDSLSGDKGSGTGLLQGRIREYERMRKSYNRNLSRRVRTDRDLFVSQIIEVQKIPARDFNYVPSGKKAMTLPGSLDEINLKNPLIIKTEGLKRWMDDAVKILVDEIEVEGSRDTLLIEAGIASIEKVRYENPLIYGWMAEYFYNLFINRNMFEGILSLQPYLEDPGCLTSLKLMVKQRSAVTAAITPGNIAPDFHFINAGGDQFSFMDYNNPSGFKLLLFWNSGCMKCLALIKQLYSWYLEKESDERPAVFTVNLDEVYNVDGWQKKVREMPEWQHMIDSGGIDSEAANAYGILTTPVLILINSDTREIVALPDSFEEIDILTGAIYH
jgi:thiol-disulfide isomerase/thioredoxin